MPLPSGDLKHRIIPVIAPSSSERQGSENESDHPERARCDTQPNYLLDRFHHSPVLHQGSRDQVPYLRLQPSCLHKGSV